MINGVVNVYKPQNISSNQVVVKIKKFLDIKKVGHTGTLDPLACGVLPICICNATKISDYLINKDKKYVVRLKFGILTDTYDCEGKILEKDTEFKVDPHEVKTVLESFIGEYEQVPPIYSAVKVDGKRAYELARQGMNFELKARKVKIYSIENIEIKDDECGFVVECSKGTYVRSLCRDIGDKLGTYATMIFLVWIQSGYFTKETSLNFDNLTPECIEKNLISIDKVISMPKIEINDFNILKLLLNGVCVKNPNYINGIDNGVYLLYNRDMLKGICERKLNFLKMIKFLG